jgi:hypothetical protein
MPDTEISAAEMVLREELTGRAEAANLSHRRGRGGSACTEEFARLELFERMMLIVLAYCAVLPADLPVLLSIRYTGVALTKHAFIRCAIKDIRFF